jgi:hypothetical protein
MPLSDTVQRLSAALADRYRIEHKLGEGGMATVYLAADLKHDRKVALKVLKRELAAVLGADRFIQEIKTTASLQHPHILPLFDSGEADGFLYYVMPFVEGETLRQKLDRETQLGIEEAVRITTDVADALHYAHERGVIHRDIKPENILLHNGRPMVADFGIALAVSAAAGGRMTETGLSLGTPHYMSPEQATAQKELTNRSDIYSLGSVLYEMLTGNPPHLGASAQQVIAKIVTEDAEPATRHRKSVPHYVAAAVRVALEKLPADRFTSAREFSDALTNPAFVPPHGAPAIVGVGGSRVQRPGMLMAVAGIALVSIVLAVWGWVRPPPPGPVIRYSVALPPLPLADVDGPQAMPAPDGSFLVFRGPADAAGPGTGVMLWMKRRDRTTATPIPGTLNAAVFTLSPDGRWIAMSDGAQLKKVPVNGGAAVILASSDAPASGTIAWLDDGAIMYPAGGRHRILQVSAAGGTPSEVWQSDSLLLSGVSALPGGHRVLVTACQGGCTEWSLWEAPRGADSARLVLPVGGWGQYLPTEQLLFSRNDGGLFVAPFDPNGLVLLGAPVPVADEVAPGIQPFRLSSSGTLVLDQVGSGRHRTWQMVWVDRTGRQTPVDTTWTVRLTQTNGNHGWALSPDGSRLAIGLFTEAGEDIWVKSLPRGPLARLSYDPAPDYRPRWTGGGRFITYASLRGKGGLYQRSADGAGIDSLLFDGAVDEGMRSPDGRWVLLRQGAAPVAAGGRDITGFRPGIDSAPGPVVVTPFDEEAIALSSDGRWLAYQSDETGRTEVYVRPFPETGSGKWQVSNGGGVAPLWSPDARELFYMSGDNDMMAATVSASPSFRIGEPQVLFRVEEELITGIEVDYYTPWDVTQDGRFLMARVVGDVDGGARSTVIVVENWLEELTAEAP